MTLIFSTNIKNTNVLLKIVNQKLLPVNQWFNGNRFSRNQGKTRFISFHRQQVRKNLVLKLFFAAIKHF